MATQRLHNSINVVDQLATLRKTVKDILHEMDAKARPVQIDAENGIDFYDTVARFEVQLIESALEMAGGRQNRAATLLRMRRSTLNSKMKQLNMRKADTK